MASTNNQSSSSRPSTSSEIECLPGQPALRMDYIPSLLAFLEQDLLTPDLDTMAPYLWMMSTPSSSNINPLNRQLVKGRKIVITEDPRLHLVWLQDRIFIKPLPPYLSSHSFWTKVLFSDLPALQKKQKVLARASQGFIRTYRHLIRHESDLRIAQQEDALLIPREISWKDMCHFLADLEVISDDDVTPRYRFGELRLSRLNFYGKFVLNKFHYERLHLQYGSYFSQFYGPLLFVFGMLSIILSALQVELAVEMLPGRSKVTLRNLSQWFSISTLVLLSVVGLGLLFVFSCLFVDEWQFAIRRRLRSKLQSQKGCALSAVP